MSVTIGEVQVEPAPEPAQQNMPPKEMPPPDVHELERAICMRRERLQRVRAH